MKIINKDNLTWLVEGIKSGVDKIVGNLKNLRTTNKDNIVNAINEIKDNFDNKVVFIENDQYIRGNKSFANPISIPDDPGNYTHAINKRYGESNFASVSNDIKLHGRKTFSDLRTEAREYGLRIDGEDISGIEFYKNGDRLVLMGTLRKNNIFMFQNLKSGGFQFLDNVGYQSESQDVTENCQFTPKWYVDREVNKRVSLNDDATIRGVKRFEGQIHVPVPTLDTHAASFKSVKDALANANFVSQEAGKGLSTNDFTDEYKNKLDNIENVINLKDRVDTEADLPQNPKPGDVYYVGPDGGDEFKIMAWNGTKWLQLGMAHMSGCDYASLHDKPSINNVTLEGNKTLVELGIASSNEIVKLTTDQNIDGNKTFVGLTTFNVCPKTNVAASNDEDLINIAYIKANFVVATNDEIDAIS